MQYYIIYHIFRVYEDLLEKLFCFSSTLNIKDCTCMCDDTIVFVKYIYCFTCIIFIYGVHGLDTLLIYHHMYLNLELVYADVNQLNVIYIVQFFCCRLSEITQKYQNHFLIADNHVYVQHLSLDIQRKTSNKL